MYTEYTAGTLIIGLVDPAADELVFGSVIQGVGDDPGDFADRIDDVDEVFDDYPKEQTGRLRGTAAPPDAPSYIGPSQKCDPRFG